MTGACNLVSKSVRAAAQDRGVAAGVWRRAVRTAAWACGTLKEFAAAQNQARFTNLSDAEFMQ